MFVWLICFLFMFHGIISFMAAHHGSKVWNRFGKTSSSFPRPRFAMAITAQWMNTLNEMHYLGCNMHIYLYIMYILQYQHGSSKIYLLIYLAFILDHVSVKKTNIMYIHINITRIYVHIYSVYIYIKIYKKLENIQLPISIQYHVWSKASASPAPANSSLSQGPMPTTSGRLGYDLR